MLEAQTAALVSATVLDEGVQRNTSEAMTTSVWYSLWPGNWSVFRASPRPHLTEGANAGGGGGGGGGGGEGVACAKEVGVRSGGAGESRGVVGNPAAVSALSAVDGRVLAYHACLDGTRQREGGH